MAPDTTTTSTPFGIGRGTHRTAYPTAPTRRILTAVRAGLLTELACYREDTDAGYTTWHRNPVHRAPGPDTTHPRHDLPARDLIAIADGDRDGHTLCGPCADTSEVRAMLFELGDELSWLETADHVLGPGLDTGPWDRPGLSGDQRTFATAGILAVLLAGADEGHHPAAASVIAEVRSRAEDTYRQLTADPVTRFRADVETLRRRPHQWQWNVRLHGDLTLTDLVRDPDAHAADPGLAAAVAQAVHRDWRESCWVLAGSPIWSAALRQDCDTPGREPVLVDALAPLFAGSSPFSRREMLRVLPNRNQLLVRIPTTFRGEPGVGRACTLVGGTIGNQPADRVLTALRLDDGVVRHNHHGATLAALEAAEL